MSANGAGKYNMTQYMQVIDMAKIEIPDPYKSFLDSIDDVSFYLVGGYVRDSILGNTDGNPDIDITTHKDNLERIAALRM